jgi:DUF971 family protein
MSIRPTQIERTDDAVIEIEWSDGVRQRFAARKLRDGCPCATCREQRGKPAADPLQLTVLAPGETVPLTVQEMKPVGNYAYGILFSDGHDTGIFTFERLRTLGETLE